MNRNEEIEARLAAFPPGPYSTAAADRLMAAGVLANEGLIAICGGRRVGWDEDQNAQFIANAPADLRWLLDQNRDLRIVAEAARELIRLNIGDEDPNISEVGAAISRLAFTLDALAEKELPG